MTGFDAFISYRRSDGAPAARRIRRLLQDYRLPRNLRPASAGKLRIYLDTIYERATNDFFEREILPALMSSRHLIVVATPDAADRGPDTTDWMRREIEAFEAGPNRGNILVVRVAGEFAGPLPGDLAARYPNIEIIDMRGQTPLAFLNPVRASRLADGAVKLAAPLLGLTRNDMPALRREEERRQQVRLGAAAGAAVAVIGAVSAASVLAIISRNNALDALSRSMYATEATIQTVRSLQPGDTRDDLLARSCDLLDSLSDRAPAKPQARTLVTCRTERSEARDRLNEPDRAVELLTDATKIAEDDFARTGSADDAIAIVEARRATLERALRIDPSDAGHAASDFATRALDLSNKITDDRTLPQTAATVLQTSAVELLQAHNPNAAMDAIQASIAAGDIALAREEHLATRLEHVVAVALKSQIHIELGELSAAADAKAVAKKMFDEMDRKNLASSGLEKRYADVANLIEKTGVAPIGR